VVGTVRWRSGGGLEGKTIAATAALDMPDASQTVYERLLDLILTLELEPGSVVTESELIARLGTSRSSLREAVVRTIDTGLTAVLPRTGIAIAPVRLLDVQNVFEARLAVEGTLARLAAERGSTDGIAAVAELERAFPVDRSPAAVLAADRRLHQAIGELARNDLLARALRMALMTSARVWGLYHQLRSFDPSDHLDHGEIVEALVARDPDAAEAAMARYLDASRARLSAVFWPQGGP